MNYDEFAFFNQQLATMLRDGLPLEGAVRQLCTGMRTGALRTELELLETDLRTGTQLKDALGRRALPEFYRRMVEMGARTNSLPGVLTLLADYYHRANNLWTRLKGLMLYPMIVISVSLGLTVLLSLAANRFLTGFSDQYQTTPTFSLVAVWMPPLLLAVAALLGVAAVTIPRWRAWLRWRLPAFREASLTQLASALALMLRNGATLAEALALAQTLEGNTPAGQALSRWRALVEAGHGKPTQWPANLAPVPPLFLWLVQNSGEDLAAGFEKAAAVYGARAAYRIELALYGALPISILLLGQMIFWQIAPLLQTLIRLMNSLGDMGG